MFTNVHVAILRYTQHTIAWRLNSSISLILPIKFSIKILFYSATKYTFYKLMADYINVFALQRFERTGVWAALRESSYGGMRDHAGSVRSTTKNAHTQVIERFFIVF